MYREPVNLYGTDSVTLQDSGNVKQLQRKQTAQGLARLYVLNNRHRIAIAGKMLSFDNPGEALAQFSAMN